MLKEHSNGKKNIQSPIKLNTGIQDVIQISTAQKTKFSSKFAENCRLIRTENFIFVHRRPVILVFQKILFISYKNLDGL